jgi:hypothetical protein
MYISTSHGIGETVYYYDADNDSVDRAKVVQITYIKTEAIDEVLYAIRIRGSHELLQVKNDTLYSRPESAFYSNPLPAEVKAAEPEPAEA